MLQELKTSFFMLIGLTLLCSGAYPLAVTAVGGTLFRSQAAGSMVAQGSLLIAQPFAKPEYFHPRPSAAGNGFDASSSGGTNFGPLSQKLMDSIKDRVKVYRSENGMADTALVPADAVTSSASGLDPHISPANAHLQVKRVATARKMDPAILDAILDKHTAGPQWGIFGEPTVNVLEINLALRPIASAAPAAVPASAVKP